MPLKMPMATRVPAMRLDGRCWFTRGIEVLQSGIAPLLRSRLPLHQRPDGRVELLIAAAAQDRRLVGDADIGLRLVVLAALAVHGAPASHRNAEAQRRV